MAIDPVTRKERILSGEDIEPVTRFEYFLKNSGGGVVFDATTAKGNISSEVTYADIDAAYSDGTKPIVLRVLSNGEVFALCPLIDRDSTSFSFFCLAYNGAGLMIGRYSITQANVWSYTYMLINGTWD